MSIERVWTEMNLNSTWKPYPIEPYLFRRHPDGTKVIEWSYGLRPNLIVDKKQVHSRFLPKNKKLIPCCVQVRFLKLYLYWSVFIRFHPLSWNRNIFPTKNKKSGIWQLQLCATLTSYMYYKTKFWHKKTIIIWISIHHTHNKIIYCKIIQSSCRLNCTEVDHPQHE